MFTGIIQHVGEVKSASQTPFGRRLTIDVGPLAEGLADGASVAVNGACLTVADRRDTDAAFDVVAETLDRTTLGALRPGSAVNLEPALAMTGRLEGHLVQGHVDGLAEVADIRRQDRWEMAFRASAEMLAELVAKGSVAVDGVSLTVADLSEETFRVALIPTTLSATTLGALAVGDRVNVETDVIGKYVRRSLTQQGPSDQGSLTLDKLRSAGFC